MIEMDFSKPTIWVMSLEPIETRYTGQWEVHIPLLLKEALSDKFNVCDISGVQLNTAPTPGAFLNFSDTNNWKSSQLINFLEKFNNRLVKPNDHILFTDAWNPTILQVKYMKDLLGTNWVLHGLWHAGSYDPQDFLGRIVGDAPWVRHTEKSFFYALDKNYFATEFHTSMFFKNLFGHEGPSEHYNSERTGKVIQTGWPMEYLKDEISRYRSTKEDLIVFPHRIAPEKQLDIFKDLAKSIPEYQFVVCQESRLTKTEYHQILGKAKMVFSANLQETLGISPYEGVLAGAIPFVPDRLSYTEMYPEEFKYPSEWTIDYNAYQSHKDLIVDKIRSIIKSYNNVDLSTVEQLLTSKFFSADNLISQIAAYK